MSRCGELAAYRKHQRKGEPIDEACSSAWAAYQQRWRAEQKKLKTAHERAARRLIEQHRADFEALLKEEIRQVS